ncbi:orexin receptor type 2-like [Mytilus edulis]|uniref:orexin receptor type 2-like n=1 Tax=Mytilus edulis TaxID=6550 RepID=UPI0039F08570
MLDFNGTNANITRNNTTCFDILDDGECKNEDDVRTYLATYITPEWYEWIVITVYILTFIIGMTGNVLVCFAVWRNHQMRTVTNMFIVNLSVADLGIILICLPPTLLVDVTETWFMGLVICKLVYFLMTVSISVSVLTLAAIAVERWYAICRPLAFKSTRRRARIIIFVIWLVSASVALPDIIFLRLKRFERVPENVSDLLMSCQPGLDQEQQTAYQIALIVLLYLLPMICICVAYIQISHVLWKGDIPGDGDSRSVTQPMMDTRRMNVANEQLASRRKAAKMLITVVLAFAVCYFPVHLLNISRYAGVLKYIAVDGIRAYSYVAHWLPYLNSSSNPIIYNFMSAKFRKEFKMACICCCGPPEKGKQGFTFTSATHYISPNNVGTEQTSLTTMK